MLTFDRYGVHWIEGDIALLVQHGKVDHVLGVPMHYEATVKLPRQGFKCPHDIRIEDAKEGNLPDDPLVRAMLPVPKEMGDKIVFVEENENNKKLVSELLRLSSTSKNEIQAMWMFAPHVIAAQLRMTNLSPLVLFGYTPGLNFKIRKILDMAYYSPRKLILIGPAYAVLTTGVARCKTNLKVEDVQDLPLEAIGAWHLKQYMENGND